MLRKNLTKIILCVLCIVLSVSVFSGCTKNHKTLTPEDFIGTYQFADNQFDAEHPDAKCYLAIFEENDVLYFQIWSSYSDNDFLEKGNCYIENNNLNLEIDNIKYNLLYKDKKYYISDGKHSKEINQISKGAIVSSE